MKTIWKFPINKEPISIPKGAKPLTTDIQDDEVILWAEVDPGVEREKRLFKVYGTGHEIPNEASYVDTFFHGYYVWHLYEIPIQAGSEGEK